MTTGGRVPIYKLKTFARFARDEGIADRSLREAVERADKGLVDADLGGNLLKGVTTRAVPRFTPPWTKQERRPTTSLRPVVPASRSASVVKLSG